MKLIIFLIVLYFSFESLPGTWLKPVFLLETNYKEHEWTSDLFYDSLSKISHIAFIDQYKHSLVYFAVDIEGRVIHNKTFSNNVWTWKAVIKGPHDGLHLYIALEWYEETLDGDIAFMESADGGETWTEIKKIPYEDDGNHRWLGDMAYNELTGRLFIVYKIKDTSQIAFVTRPPGSNIFTKEKAIIEDVKYDSYNPINLIFNSKDNMLHMFFTSLDYLFYSSSVDNGNTWKEKKILTSGSTHAVYGAAVNGSISKNIYLAYDLIQSKSRMLMVSKNNAVDFPIKIPLADVPASKHFAPRTEIALCGTKENPILVSFVTGENGKLEYTLWDAEQIKGFDRDHPFENMDILAASFSCRLLENNHELIVPVAIVKRVENSCELYFTYEHIYSPGFNQ